MRITIAMTAIMLFGACIGAATGAADPAAVIQGTEPVIQIVARRYRFEPDTISLKKGVPVILEMTSPEVTMSLDAPDFRISEELRPGERVRVRLVPDRTGDFAFVCDIYCGSGHEKMKGVIKVAAGS